MTFLHKYCIKKHFIYQYNRKYFSKNLRLAFVLNVKKLFFLAI